MREDSIQGPWHTGEIQCAHEQSRRPDLATAACAQEAPELFRGGPSPPLGLLLEGAERHQIPLGFEDTFDEQITKYEDVPFDRFDDFSTADGVLSLRELRGDLIKETFRDDRPHLIEQLQPRIPT